MVITSRLHFQVSSLPPPPGNSSERSTSAAEMSAGIICGCMPVLAALFRSRASREYRFPSLRYFSWRNYSRRLIISNDKLRPPNNSLHLEKPPTGSEQELSGSDLELESGTSVTNSNGVLRVARDF